MKAYGACLVLAALALLSGCGSSSSGEEEASASSTPVEESKAVLHEIGGSGASGVSVLKHGPIPTIQYDFEGLKPTGGIEESQYAVWLTGPARFYMLGSYRVGQGGTLKTGPERTSNKVFAYVEDRELTTLLVTREHPPKLRAAIAKPNPKHPKIPDYYGRKVMSGTFSDPSAGD
jgi:hypothetical protein